MINILTMGVCLVALVFTFLPISRERRDMALITATLWSVSAVFFCLQAFNNWLSGRGLLIIFNVIAIVFSISNAKNWFNLANGLPSKDK